MPTAAEADILAVLWRLGPATVREVHDALEKDCDYNTTLTQMRLMTDKGLLVRRSAFGRTSMNRRAQEPDADADCGDLLKRVFEGSPKELIMSALGRSLRLRGAGGDSPDARRTGKKERRVQMNAIQILATQPWVERLGLTLLHFLWQGT